MKVRTVSISEAKTPKKRRTKEEMEERLDYTSLPRFTEQQWFNLCVFGTKTTPKEA